MSGSRNARIEIYVITFAAVIVVGFAAVLASDQDRSTTRAAATPVTLLAAPPTVSVTLSALPPTAGSTSAPSPTATPDVLENAKIRTELDAIVFGLDLARGLGAKDPRLVAVSVHEIDEAIAISSDPGDDPGPGWAADGAAGLAWVIQFDNAEFGIPSCPPPEPTTPDAKPGDGHSCGTAPTAVFVVRASDGSVVSMALGPPVPR